MSDHKYESIYDRFLVDGQRLLLEFLEGVTALRVVDFVDYPIPLIVKNLTALAANGTLDWQKLTHPKIVGSAKLDQVEPEHAGDMVRHIGFGFKPGSIRVYPKFPDNQALIQPPNLDPVAVGSDYGFFLGRDSPYWDPSVVGERIIPYGMYTAWGFHNHTEGRAIPVMRMVVRDYFVEPILDKGEIGDMVRGKSVLTKTMGPVWAKASINAECKKAWGAPVPRATARSY